MYVQKNVNFEKNKVAYSHKILKSDTDMTSRTQSRMGPNKKNSAIYLPFNLFT